MRTSEKEPSRDYLDWQDHSYLDKWGSKLISDVKTALTNAAPVLDANHLRIENVKLDLEATLELNGGVKFTLFKILTFEAKHTHTETQTITVKLKPPEVKAENLEDATIQDKLTQAIVVIAAAAKEAAASPPELVLDEAEVALEVAITNEGSIEVFAEGSAKEGNMHTLTIGLKSA
jgi:hypothetical protein